MFIVKCSWCNLEISRDPGPDEISHGICPLCYVKTMREIRSFLPRDISLIQKTVLGKNSLVEQY